MSAIFFCISFSIKPSNSKCFNVFGFCFLSCITTTWGLGSKFQCYVKMWQSDRSKAQFCCFCLTTVSLLAQLELSHGLAPSMTSEHEATYTRPILQHWQDTTPYTSVINQLPNPELNSASRRGRSHCDSQSI